jgi:hypothetical protein
MVDDDDMTPFEYLKSRLKLWFADAGADVEESDAFIAAEWDAYKVHVTKRVATFAFLTRRSGWQTVPMRLREPYDVNWIRFCWMQAECVMHAQDVMDELQGRVKDFMSDMASINGAGAAPDDIIMGMKYCASHLEQQVRRAREERHKY